MANLFQPDVGSGFTMAVTTTVSATTTNQFRNEQSTFYVYNAGPNIACLRWGKTGVTAVATDLAIAPGSSQTFGKEGANSLSAICPTGTATLYIAPGEGE